MGGTCWGSPWGRAEGPRVGIVAQPCTAFIQRERIPKSLRTWWFDELTSDKAECLLWSRSQFLLAASAVFPPVAVAEVVSEEPCILGRPGVSLKRGGGAAPGFSCRGSELWRTL